MTRFLTKNEIIRQLDHDEEIITYSIIFEDSSEPANAFTFNYITPDSWNFAFDNFVKAIKPAIVKHTTLRVHSIMLDDEV